MAADGRGSRFGAVGRLAFFPARAAARASRRPIEAAADEHLVPELSRLADRALAGSLPEELAHSVVEHRVLERVAAQLAESGALDRAVDNALANPKTGDLVDRLVKSDQMQRAIRDVVASPEVRAAIAEQSVGLAGEVAADLRDRSADFDDRVEAAVRRRPREGPRVFAGVATRAIVFALDLLLIAAILLIVGGFLGVISYLVGGLRPKWLVGALVGAGSAVVATAYLVFFWSGTGRTPGMQFMGVRVRGRADKPPSIVRALVRAAVTWISIVPFFLGYVTILSDRRRRALPDLVAGTEVVYDEP